MNRLLKELPKHLSALSDGKLFVARYLVNVVLVAEILILPLIVKPSSFVEIEYYRNILILIPFLLLGINSGYLPLLYRHNTDAKYQLLRFGTFLGLAGAVIVYCLQKSVFFSFSVFAVLLYLSVEKILIARKYLVFVSIAKSMASVSVLAAFNFMRLYEPFSINEFDLYYAGYAIGIIIWFVFLIARIDQFLDIDFLELVQKFDFRNDIFQVAELIRHGFPIALQTWLLFYLFLIDRDIFIESFQESAPSYNLMFSLGSIFFIGLNTVAFSLQVKFGVGLDRFDRAAVFSLFRSYSVVFIFGLVGAYFCIWILAILDIFSNYDGFVDYSFPILVLHGGYYFFASFFSLLIYRGRNDLLVLGMIIVVLISWAANSIIVDHSLSPTWIVYKTGFVLLVYSIFMFLCLVRGLTRES